MKNIKERDLLVSCFREEFPGLNLFSDDFIAENIKKTSFMFKGKKGKDLVYLTGSYINAMLL